MGDLSHIHARGLAIGREGKLGLTFQFNENELFECLNIILIKRLFERVHDDDALLVGNRAEGESLDHVEHRIDYFGF